MPTQRPKSPAPERNHWLFKSEPDVFSIEHLRRAPGGVSLWDGVRNYQARNFLRDEIEIGDGVLFYHSSCAVPAIAGWCEVVRGAYPDPTQFVSTSQYFDPKSSANNPRWFSVDVRHCHTFARPLELAALRGDPMLAGMRLLQKGSRLSIQPVTGAEWDHILQLASASTSPPVKRGD